MAEVVVITGPCGAGKSSVAFECMAMLEKSGVPAAMVDAELAYFHPKPPLDPFGYAVAEEGLRALGAIYASRGIERLLLARVVEDAEQFSLLERALPGARIKVFRLVASPATIHGRLRARETGSGLAWHLARSEAIARAALGDPVDAERPVTEIAREILERAGW